MTPMSRYPQLLFSLGIHWGDLEAFIPSPAQSLFLIYEDEGVNPAGEIFLILTLSFHHNVPNPFREVSPTLRAMNAGAFFWNWEFLPGQREDILETF